MSTDDLVLEDKLHETNKVTWKDRYKFPPGASLLLFYQLISGIGSYCFILSMPIYMASILQFSDTASTSIYHAKAGVGTLVNICGAIIADSFIGRSKTYLFLHPFNLLLLVIISILSIYTQKEGIIVCYFLMAIFGGLISPAVRAIIADQIPQENKTMLSTFLHIIYFLNNFGVILIAYVAPIMHKDIYCFGMECYPLVFGVAFLLSGTAFVIFLTGLFCKLFIIFKPTDNLLLNIIKCVHLALKKRIVHGKLSKDQSWLDYAEEKFDKNFIKDLKIAKGLLIFLLAHPLFWTVFEQLSSIWTLQAQYMDGMITESFVIKADQMQTLNPILVVLLIPLFEILIYPILTKINFKVPYRIMSGQFFTAFACASMIFIQLQIDKVVTPKDLGNVKINLVNLVDTRVTVRQGSNVFELEQFDTKTISEKNSDSLNITYRDVHTQISILNYKNKIISSMIYDGNISSQEVSVETNGGYAKVRIFNYVDYDFPFSIFIKAKYGINKEFNLKAKHKEMGSYVKCGIGLFEVFMKNSSSQQERLGQMMLHPAESKTLIVLRNRTTNYIFKEISEERLILPSIAWQIIPYLLVTIGEVLFNVNTGIFLYGEAPISMKSMLLAAELVCIALGNILILILKQILKNLSTSYLFLVCTILVALSGALTGALGYFYLKNKSVHQSTSEDTHKVTEL